MQTASIIDNWARVGKMCIWNYWSGKNNLKKTGKIRWSPWGLGLSKYLLVMEKRSTACCRIKKETKLLWVHRQPVTMSQAERKLEFTLLLVQRIWLQSSGFLCKQCTDKPLHVFFLVDLFTFTWIWGSSWYKVWQHETAKHKHKSVFKQWLYLICMHVILFVITGAKWICVLSLKCVLKIVRKSFSISKSYSSRLNRAMKENCGKWLQNILLCCCLSGGVVYKRDCSDAPSKPVKDRLQAELISL